MSEPDDTALIDFLADRTQWIANVQLPIACVESHPDDFRAAVRMAMRMHAAADDDA